MINFPSHLLPISPRNRRKIRIALTPAYKASETSPLSVPEEALRRTMNEITSIFARGVSATQYCNFFGMVEVRQTEPTNAVARCV
jgi:hypothetical protein